MSSRIPSTDAGKAISNIRSGITTVVVSFNVLVLVGFKNGFMNPSRGPAGRDEAAVQQQDEAHEKPGRAACAVYPGCGILPPGLEVGTRRCDVWKAQPEILNRAI